MGVLPHSSNCNCKYQNRKYERGKFDTPNTQIHDHSFLWLKY